MMILKHMKTLKKMLHAKEMIPQRHFKNNYKLNGIDLSKQEVLDADPIAIQQINFTGKLDQAGNKTIFFSLEWAKELIWTFCKELWQSCKCVVQ